ncbi:MAG: DNA-3-methyladenine glycosylase [Actinomycetota bacterium]|nr:DNA-3-methyladenine glycosylase [Actinomycetota bacterium]
MRKRRPELLPRAFFDRPAIEVAPELLGCVLEHDTDAGLVAVRLTEVEAYHGDLDPGSHAFKGRTPRNAVMFGEPGHIYVYFTYGMHFCMNLVCAPAGTASAVLLRAGAVVEGAEVAAGRRGGAVPRELARGPARLTVALGVARADNGVDACDPSSPLRVLRAESGGTPPAAISVGPRVGVSAGVDTPWRFWLDGEPTVSVYRPHAPGKRSRNPAAGRGARTQGFGA